MSAQAMIAQNRQPYVNTRQDNQFQFFGSPTVMRSTGETTDGHFCLLESLSMPPGLASPYHVHHNEDEAFYILEGTAQVYISTPMAHVATRDSGSGFLSKIKSMLKPRREDQRNEEGRRATIPIDAPVDLDYRNPIAELGPGELFGEMTCMSYYPRSATVRAATDCVMLEMLRNVLDIMQRNKTFRAKLEQTYKERALDSHLRSVPIFSTLTPEFIRELRPRVELRRYAPGEVICRQGEPADAFYLVRLGFVKVSEQRPGGDGDLLQAARVMRPWTPAAGSSLDM